jgi:hypothetical protein
MKGLGYLLILLVPGLLHGQSPEKSVQQKFVSGGMIRMHLEAGGYTVSAGDSENIRVTYEARSEEQLKQVKVEIKSYGGSADIYVTDTPNGNFHATIEVPRRSNLRVRLTAGELVVEDVEGDKDLEVRAGRLQADVPHPEQYGHRDASVLTGSINASVFDISKGGLFRSFEQRGPGKYRLHTHVMTGRDRSALKRVVGYLEFLGVRANTR